MLAGTYQAVDVLLLFGSVGPIALYFLFLGLVNSHSRPYLLTCRSDFISLTVVLFPVLLWPIPMFARSGMWWLPVSAFLLAGTLFFQLLPSAGAGLVVYNISEKQCMGLLSEAIRRLRWTGHWHGRTWQGNHGAPRVLIRPFGLLRNVTIYIEPDPRCHRDEISQLQAELGQRLSTVSQIPSTAGACLVVMGVGLLILPLWMASRHIDALVDAMSHLFG